MWTLAIIWSNGNETLRVYADEASCWEAAELVDEDAEVYVLKPGEEW